MIVDNVLILFTNSPQTPRMRAVVQHMQALGQEVFLQPLKHLQQEKTPTVKRAVKASLASIQPN